jgi:zinc protease
MAQVTPAPPAGGRGSRPAAAASAPLPSYKDLRYPELRPIVFPRIERVTLPNGMRLDLVEDHELPLINGTVLVRMGTLFDPPEKIGLAALTGQVLLGGGTTNRPDDNMVRRFQDLGAEIDGRVTENYMAIAFSGLKDNGDEVLDALKDLLTVPEFQQERIDLAKVRARNAIAHRNDDAAAILRREFIATLYGKDTPYGAQIEYTNLDRINRSDLMGFYQRYFFPKNVMIQVEGDFDTARIKARIEALFGGWNADQPPVPEFPKAGPEGASGKFLAVKKDVTQAYFAVGQLGGDYLDKDGPALEIAAEILGTGQRGRLNQRFRGAVSNLAATFSPGLGHPGHFEVTGNLNAFHTTQAIRGVMEEFAHLRTAEATEEEFRAAKDVAMNSLVFTFDKYLSIMPRLLEYEYFNLPADYTQQYQRALLGVTRADVLRVARERLDPARMTVMVVANPTAFEEPLEALGGGAVNPVDLTIPPPARAEAVLGDPSTERRGKELLAHAQQAMGGAAKLAAVADYSQDVAYQFDVSAGGAQATMTERWLAPGNLRQDSSTSAGKYSVYCDGKAGWISSSRGSTALAGIQLKQVQGDMFRVLYPLLLSDRVPTRKVNALDQDTVEISDGAGQIVKLVFDSGTGLLKNIVYDAPTANGPVPVIETYSDYRDAGGMKLPFKVVFTLSGQRYQELTVKNIQFNTGLKIQDLEKRP